MSFQNGEQLLQDLSATNLNEVIEKTPIGDQPTKKDKTNNCKELQNIAYKTKRFNGTEIVPLIVNTNNSTLSNFLNNETIANEKDNWCKLDKIGGAILDIPHLLFDITARSFLLRKDDKHVSTVKSLPLDKKLKVKTIKIHENTI